MSFQDARRCSAKSKRSQKPCKNPAVVGSNVCRMHGGKAPVGVANHNFKHGRFSKALPASIRALYDQSAEDKALCELRDEMALTDALLHSRLEKIYTNESPQFWSALKSLWNRYLDDTKKLEKLSAKAQPNSFNDDFPEYIDEIKPTSPKSSKRRSKEADEIRDREIMRLTAAIEKTRANISHIINRGLETYNIFENIQPFLEQRRRLTESENKRLVQLSQMIPAEKAFVMVARLAEIVKKYVHEPETLREICRELGGTVAGGENYK